ncbi:uncharacterized protein LOC132203225 [Neocloeon triangulifer]|uniref:uncharacterized protein LOC132203225 n=1 Tax=Neocloeon triangulifer TaxID=2078957 RepID=UPI00286F4F7B|nr:uncharacterized protein LOC132203225 [Neocloeon triangulifer]
MDGCWLKATLRKLEAQKRMEEAEKMMLDEKLTALKNNFMTDCVLVAAGGSETNKLVNAVKRDLMVASLTFEQSFNAMTTKSRMVVRNFQPNIIELLIEFTHIGRFLNPITNVDVAVSLNKVARSFKVEPLIMYTNHLIISLLEVDNVWQVMNSITKMPLDASIQDACLKLLASCLKQCINHPTFFSANEESLIAMLQVDPFFADADEFVLLKACLDWTLKQPVHYRRSCFRSLLPYLRILSLDGEAVQLISEYITEEEQTALFNAFSDSDQEVPNVVCKAREGRFLTSSKHTNLTLIPENVLKIQQRNFTVRSGIEITNRLTFIASHDLHLAGFQILNRVQMEKLSPVKKLRLQRTNTFEYEEVLRVSISNSHVGDYCEQITVKSTTNEPLDVVFLRHLFVPKESIVVIKIDLVNPQGCYKGIDASAVLKSLKDIDIPFIRLNELSLKNLNDDFEYEDPYFYFIQAIKCIPIMI